MKKDWNMQSVVLTVCRLKIVEILYPFRISERQTIDTGPLRKLKELGLVLNQIKNK